MAFARSGGLNSQSIPCFSEGKYKNGTVPTERLHDSSNAPWYCEDSHRSGFMVHVHGVRERGGEERRRDNGPTIRGVGCRPCTSLVGADAMTQNTMMEYRSLMLHGLIDTLLRTDY